VQADDGGWRERSRIERFFFFYFFFSCTTPPIRSETKAARPKLLAASAGEGATSMAVIVRRVRRVVGMRDR